MNCTICGHPYDRHAGEHLLCRVYLAKGWNLDTRTFKATDPCPCTGYQGKIPSACPHETLPFNTRCVHCGAHTLTRKDA